MGLNQYSGGLVNKVFTNWLSLAFLNPVLEVFDLFILPFYIPKWRLQCKGVKSKLTQEEGNKYDLNHLYFNIERFHHHL
jgi:hypothetical protein